MIIYKYIYYCIIFIIYLYLENNHIILITSWEVKVTLETAIISWIYIIWLLEYFSSLHKHFYINSCENIYFMEKLTNNTNLLGYILKQLSTYIFIICSLCLRPKLKHFYIFTFITFIFISVNLTFSLIYETSCQVRVFQNKLLNSYVWFSQFWNKLFLFEKMNSKIIPSGFFHA